MGGVGRTKGVDYDRPTGAQAGQIDVKHWLRLELLLELKEGVVKGSGGDRGATNSIDGF